MEVLRVQQARLSTVPVVSAVVLSLALLFSGCGGGGDSPAGDGDGAVTARIVLTDAPRSDIQEVHVHIVRIEAVSDAGTVLLVGDEDIPDDIELMALAADPMLLGERNLPPGSYTQLRMIVNDAPGTNYIIDGDGVRHDLTVPSGPQTGIKLLTSRFTATEGSTITILLDFDAAASVHQAGRSGQWIMRPTVFANIIQGVQISLGTIRGTVLNAAGEPLPVPEERMLGVFVETEEGVVAVGEVSPEDGTFEIATVVAGDYDLTVRYADAGDWENPDEPLQLDVEGALVQAIAFLLGADQTLDLQIVVATE